MVTREPSVTPRPERNKAADRLRQLLGAYLPTEQYEETRDILVMALSYARYEGIQLGVAGLTTSEEIAAEIRAGLTGEEPSDG